MIIERDTVGRFRRTQDKRFYFFESELEDGRRVRAQRKYWWPARTFRSLRSQAKKKPAGVLNLGKLSWWLYKGKVYLPQGHPRPTEVANFLDSRHINGKSRFSRKLSEYRTILFREQKVNKQSGSRVWEAVCRSPCSHAVSVTSAWLDRARAASWQPSSWPSPPCGHSGPWSSLRHVQPAWPLPHPALVAYVKSSWRLQHQDDRGRVRAPGAG